MGNPFETIKPRVQDRFGEPVAVGDLVQLDTNPGIFYRVVQMRPLDHDPRMPKGAIQLGLVSTWSGTVVGDGPIEALVKIRDAAKLEAVPEVNLVAAPGRQQ